MLTLRIAPEDASLPRVIDRLGLREEEIDSDFGVISLGPDTGLSAVLVEDSAASRVADRDDVEGPFSNPRIEPQGPPEPHPGG